MRVNWLRRIEYLVRASIVAAVFFLSPTQAFAVDVFPIGDTWINLSNNNNHGVDQNLGISSTQTAVIRFDLSTLPPSPSIAKASLVFYVNAITRTGSFTIRQVNTAWNETDTTVSSLLISHLTTPPGPNPGGTSFTLHSTDLNNFVTVDVTDLVRSWATGTVNNGLALVANGSTSFQIDSKENGGQASVITIALAGPPGPTGP